MPLDRFVRGQDGKSMKQAFLLAVEAVSGEI